MIEPKIDEVFYDYGKKLKCILGKGQEDCSKCFFRHKDCHEYICADNEREDYNNVFFRGV